MSSAEGLVIVDWSNYSELQSIIDSYKDSESMFLGENENGEDIQIHVGTDNIILVTFQKNGWTRKNTYWPAHEICEEEFEGRWK